MFAVIVMGIGFIMVAAMFPVSISQSRLTVEETTAAALARNAMAQTTRLAEGGDSPPVTVPPTWGPLLPPTDLYKSPPARQQYQTVALASTPFTVPAHSMVTVPGKVFTFDDARLDDGLGDAPTPSPIKYQSNLWNAFRRNLIVPSDNRYAWVALYRRDVTYFNNSPADFLMNLGNRPNINSLVAMPAPFAQVYFLPVAVRNRTLYDNGTTATNPDLTGANANLLPRLLQVSIERPPAAGGQYVLSSFPRLKLRCRSPPPWKALTSSFPMIGSAPRRPTMGG